VFTYGGGEGDLREFPAPPNCGPGEAENRFPYRSEKRGGSPYQGRQNYILMVISTWGREDKAPFPPVC